MFTSGYCQFYCCNRNAGLALFSSRKNQGNPLAREVTHRTTVELFAEADDFSDRQLLPHCHAADD